MGNLTVELFWLSWKAASLILGVTTTLLLISVILVGVLLGGEKDGTETTIYNTSIVYTNGNSENVCLTKECINAGEP